MKKKYLYIIILLILAAVAIAMIVFTLFIKKPESAKTTTYIENQAENNANGNGSTTEEPVYCTQDVMKCPDGSYVGRVPPDCNFSPCPSARVAK